ncbi:MAG: hypothetical protein HY331_07175 [Chloroflexi bacterium]|nr:hypothetical protein [Chloroflexota bacterium]
MTLRPDEMTCPRCGALLPAGSGCPSPNGGCPACCNEAAVFERSVFFGTAGSLVRVKRLVEEALGMHFTIRQHTDCFEDGRLRSELTFGGRFLFTDVWLKVNTAADPPLSPYRFVLHLSAELEPAQVSALDHLATAIAKRIEPHHPDRPPLVYRASL